MSPRRLELDYVAAPRRSHWIGIAVLAIALAVAVHFVYRYRDTQHQLAALQATEGLLNVERPPRTVPKERLEEETKQVDAMVRKLTLPWAQIIEAVESASTPEVTVLQMQPEAQQRLLRLVAEAKNKEAMIKYIRRLDATKVLSEVHPVSHQVQVDDPSRPIQFGVQASFKGEQ